MEPISLTEFARLGGKARAKKMSKARRHEIAVAAGKAAGRVHNRKATERKNATER